MRKRLSMLLLAAFAILPGCEQQKTAENQIAAEAPDESGKGVDRSHAGSQMPDSELFNADEDKATLAGAKGKPLLVNLWASWCGPCVKELPTLDGLSRKPGAPRIIAVSEDVGERAGQAHLGIAPRFEVLDPMALQERLDRRALAVSVMPTTVYYDSAGREVWRYVGDLDWNGDEAAKLLAEAR